MCLRGNFLIFVNSGINTPSRWDELLGRMTNGEVRPVGACSPNHNTLVMEWAVGKFRYMSSTNIAGCNCSFDTFRILRMSGSGCGHTNNLPSLINTQRNV